LLPHMLDSCMLLSRAGIRGALRCSPGSGCRGYGLPGQEKRPLQILMTSQAPAGFMDSVICPQLDSPNSASEWQLE
ncbi:hypothetical protein P7K49_031455, partial [Saguinus oedipus]